MGNPYTVLAVEKLSDSDLQAAIQRYESLFHTLDDTTGYLDERHQLVGEALSLLRHEAERRIGAVGKKLNA